MAFIFKREIHPDDSGAPKTTLQAKETFRDPDGLTSGEVQLHLSSDGSHYEGKALANRLSQRRTWPLHRLFGFIALTYHRFPGQEPDKCLLMDLATFSHLMEAPKPFLRELRRHAAELCNKWNASYGGAKAVGKRGHPEKTFSIEEVEVPYGSKKFRSEFRLTVGTWHATRDMKDSHSAKMTPEKLVISIKHATSVPPRASKEEWDETKMRLSSYGLYMPFYSFEKLCLSKQVAAMVKVAKNHLEQRPQRRQNEPRMGEEATGIQATEAANAEEDGDDEAPEAKKARMET